MKDNLTRSLTRAQRSFTAFTTGQKVVAVLGTGALLLAAFMVFSWASKPAMTPLFSNMSAEDTAAVVEELTAQGVPYEIAGGGTTVMVPQDTVYETRIALSGEGLPASSGQGGYSILDGQDLSTSEFQEQTDFKRAMEGELSRTIEGIDGVGTAVVHLALPQKEVFADEQEPATASVLVSTSPGAALSPEQVQSVVHLVASSIDGLDPDRVTVADGAGTLLTPPADSAMGAASTRAQQVSEVQDEMTRRIQATLDRIAGPGNATVQVTADLNFDQTVTESTRYEPDPDNPPLSSSEQTETYEGAGGGLGTVGGVVGPDGQMEGTDGTVDGASSYEKSTRTQDNAIDTITEVRESAPGEIDKLGIGVVIDSGNAAAIDPNQVQQLVAATVGVDPRRGDTISVSSMPFDRSAEEAAAAEIAAAEAADAKSAQMTLFRNAGLGLLIALLVVVAWLKSRKKGKQRAEATTYVVEQLRADAAARAAAAQQAALEAQTPAMAALAQSENALTDDLRDELASLVERQPEDVAALLRGWLVEKP
ncbi:flagellar basal-body MS-ring/collar protein FliF [Nocardioides perillae]|uniref:Flagellar M-ring protein n=1 Tax=Nocardioides perillae TaxID=1119534 RepID=A0A7Y9RYF0_9ACTN|nr:flagellar basal-body MS-ring/collar protein FliF [Nocardioides perillae]NYG57033.1 flagellar M-ring protein FliF [Nocardioides perillae]